MKISMKQVTAGVLIGLGLAVSQAPLAVAADSPFSANIGLFSDYAFRGISQTTENPAIQGGFDYAHDSGFYAGVWASNVRSDWYAGSIEMDGYFGYSGSIGEIGYDVGYLRYQYPDQSDQNTNEFHLGASYKWLSATVHYSPDYFALGKAFYYEAGLDFTLPGEVGLGLHIGKTDFTQEEKGGSDYVDYKVGLSKSFSGFDFSLAYVDTDIDNDKQADSRVIFGIAKTF